jgi:hypothetical protein
VRSTCRASNDKARGAPPNDPAAARRAALERDAFVDVMTSRKELAKPLTITSRRDRGLHASAKRTVLSGRGHEPIQLANTDGAEAQHANHRPARPVQEGKRGGTAFTT